MVWHACRRLSAMQDLQRVSDQNLRLLGSSRQFLQEEEGFVSAMTVGGILTLVIPLGTVVVISGWLWMRYRRDR
ncbi:MAG TPA: hypothetical protein VMU89_24880 [Thermomicrobiaceae bacterium]|nr:hypothetical protein [Thermomicrobiaceae bacterium]